MESIVFTQTDVDAMSREADGYRVFPGNIDFTQVTNFGDKIRFGHGCRFKSLSSFGIDVCFDRCCVFGDCCTFGSNVCIGPASVIGDNPNFGRNCRLGDFTHIGHCAKFQHGVLLGSYSSVGNSARFEGELACGDACKFGPATWFGDNARFGGHTSFHHSTHFQQGLSICGIFVRKVMLAQSIDGTGRQIKLLIGVNPEDDRVEAGCFFGSVEAFAAKAKSEGKHVYAAVIPAMRDAYWSTLAGG